MNEAYLLGIAALLPLSALITVCQRNPYHALVSRGMLGAVAALLYAVLGAADVAITEALMGTLLTIILYGVAVRSCLTVRVAWLAGGRRAGRKTAAPPGRVFAALKDCCRRHHLRLEITAYPDAARLTEALRSGAVDAACGRVQPMARLDSAIDMETDSGESASPLVVLVRSESLLRLLERELNATLATVRLFSKTGFSELP